MSPLLKEYLYKKVVLVTTSGECLIATLEGFDKSTNLIVSKVYERFMGEDNILSEVQLLRGSEIVLCGLYEPSDVEKARESRFALDGLRINDTKNRITDEHIIWTKVAEHKRHLTTKKRKIIK